MGGSKSNARGLLNSGETTSSGNGASWFLVGTLVIGKKGLESRSLSQENIGDAGGWLSGYVDLTFKNELAESGTVVEYFTPSLNVLGRGVILKPGPILPKYECLSKYQ